MRNVFGSQEVLVCPVYEIDTAAGTTRWVGEERLVVHWVTMQPSDTWVSAVPPRGVYDRPALPPSSGVAGG
jgi:hypothetical protein